MRPDFTVEIGLFRVRFARFISSMTCVRLAIAAHLPEPHRRKRTALHSTAQLNFPVTRFKLVIPSRESVACKWLQVTTGQLKQCPTALVYGGAAKTMTKASTAIYQ